MHQNNVINEALKDFGTTDRVKQMEVSFGGGKVPQHIVDFYIKQQNYFAFLLGCLYDQQMKAEIVWQIPFNLYKTIGHLDPDQISAMSADDLIFIFNKLPNQPRYPRQMANWSIAAAQRVISYYSGKVENIWAGNSSCLEVTSRFEEFTGMGQKKAAMATAALVKKYNIPLRNRSGLDIAADSLVIRVFKRCGLVEKEDKDIVILKARQLNPDHPGVLDRPCWEIGRSYCFLTNPDCNNCAINRVCSKKI